MSDTDSNNQADQTGAGDEAQPDISREQAADLVRQRIHELHDKQEHGDEPASLLDRFWHRHKDHPNQSEAWNSYYEALNAEEKKKLWEEYREKQWGDVEHNDPAPTVSVQAQTVTHNEPAGANAKEDKPQTVADLKQKLLSKHYASNGNKQSKKRRKHHISPALAGFTVAAFVLLLNYNDLAFAQVKQFISPGDTINSPIIIDPNASVNVGKESRVIIPKINVDVPVVYDEPSYEEVDIQNALERGVVHYGDTGLPGQPGNNVIVGHSSNNFFNGGKYKFAFVLLSRLEKGDTFMLHYKGTRYIYRVYTKQIVEPDDFSLIQPTSTPTATLITCDPPGTSWKRLIIQGEQISPVAEKTDKADLKPLDIGDKAEEVPGNSQSLFQRFQNWITGS